MIIDWFYKRDERHIRDIQIYESKLWHGKNRKDKKDKQQYTK